ncbi:MAG: hypothetical protein HY426_01315 [Candidatus Levybacteria bacterium]|nr:hypothetical protein [Candidatus Levybacteria bacterium]
MKRKKQHNRFVFSYFSKFFLLFLIFLILVSFSNESNVAQRLFPRKDYYQKPISTEIQRDIKALPTQAAFDWSVEKVDEHITKISLPPDPRMSTSDELFEAMNNYRRAHNVQMLTKNETLCSIAQNRANEQLALGDLDNHEGFDKYAENQEEFYRMGEVLFGGVQPQYGVHIVEYGWDRSLTGHKEAIQNPSWNHGCGGIAGYFAVFIFGTK